MVNPHLIYEMSTSIDLKSMSLMALKKMAKGQRIKQYYVLPKSKLVELLSLPDLPAKYKIEKMTIMELRDMAKERGLRGFWGLNKEDLTRALFPKNDDTIENAPAHQKQEDDSQTSKHQEPEKENSNDVGVKVVENA